MLFQPGVPGVANDETPTHHSDPSSRPGHAHCGFAGADELGGRVDVPTHHTGLDGSTDLLLHHRLVEWQRGPGPLHCGCRSVVEDGDGRVRTLVPRPPRSTAGGVMNLEAVLTFPQTEVVWMERLSSEACLPTVVSGLLKVNETGWARALDPPAEHSTRAAELGSTCVHGWNLRDKQ